MVKCYQFIGTALALCVAAPALADDASSDCQALIAAQPDDWHEGAGAVQSVQGATVSSPEDLAEIVARRPGAVHVIKGGRFTGWDFTGIERALTGLCFYQSDLTRTRWDGRDLRGSAFVRSDLSEARFAGAGMPRVLLHDARLVNTDMQAADLTGGVLSGGWFTDLSEVAGREDVSASLDGWNLRGANLSGFRFDCSIEVINGCPLDRSIDLTGANLTGADFSTFAGWGGFTVSDARLDGTLIAPDQLVYYIAAERAGPVVLAGGDLREPVSAQEAGVLMEAFAAARQARDAPSFPCPAATSAAEKAICSDEGKDADLPQLDRHMAAAFASARQRSGAVIAEQRRWLAQRNRCADVPCLAEAYEARLAAILPRTGLPVGLSPGSPQLYIEQNLVLPQIAGSGDLITRINPVLVAASDQWIAVTMQRDGTLSVSGQSIGANAHICTLDADGLTMDPANGWYALPAEGERRVPVIRLIGDTLEVFANGRPDYDEWPDIEHVSCGMRASFVTAARIAADPATIAAVAHQWDD